MVSDRGPCGTASDGESPSRWRGAVPAGFEHVSSRSVHAGWPLERGTAVSFGAGDPEETSSPKAYLLVLGLQLSSRSWDVF